MSHPETTDDALAALVRPDRYPLSSAYDPRWLVGLDMGPNPLWLLEDLCHDLDLRPGMRVLDLGAGRGATSVFLARELGVEVVAADLWVDPADVTAVLDAAGVADRVRAVRAEAHSLPFEPASFDAVVCIDAFEYFGTSEHYLPHLTRLLVPGGRLGVATPALRREVRDLGAVPPHVAACVGWEALAWHTPEWWRFHWEVTGLVTDVVARLKHGGWDDWLRWQRAVAALGPVGADADREAAHASEAAAAVVPDGAGADAVLTMLEADGGELLSFTLLSARTPV
ncbi:SAM-dependent methyltransferase [Cellulomonas cellasea]|uniref:SAM-dependent methyltransferase n=1 Tax=Cellulomonas cellasea TaxID=43670 RepID=UPI001FE5DEB0|nr:methyltransferase domain-containing protein [Cellulomonas cellasea]